MASSPGGTPNPLPPLLQTPSLALLQRYGRQICSLLLTTWGVGWGRGKGVGQGGGAGNNGGGGRWGGGGGGRTGPVCEGGWQAWHGHHPLTTGRQCPITGPSLQAGGLSLGMVECLQTQSAKVVGVRGGGVQSAVCLSGTCPPSFPFSCSLLFSCKCMCVCVCTYKCCKHPNQVFSHLRVIGQRDTGGSYTQKRSHGMETHISREPQETGDRHVAHEHGINKRTEQLY